MTNPKDPALDELIEKLIQSLDDFQEIDFDLSDIKEILEEDNSKNSGETCYFCNGKLIEKPLLNFNYKYCPTCKK